MNGYYVTPPREGGPYRPALMSQADPESEAPWGAAEEDESR